jgi:hypothetical protein
MEIETTTRLYALELLTTQLIAEYLRSVPDPDGQANWAKRQLHGAADGMAIEMASLDEEARLRLGVKDNVTRILGAALARAKATPFRQPPYDTGPQAG